MRYGLKLMDRSWGSSGGFPSALYRQLNLQLMLCGLTLTCICRPCNPALQPNPAQLEAAQSSVVQTEAALARSNPALFAAVQLSAGPALASLRDQVRGQREGKARQEQQGVAGPALASLRDQVRGQKECTAAQGKQEVVAPALASLND